VNPKEMNIIPKTIVFLSLLVLLITACNPQSPPSPPAEEARSASRPLPIVGIGAPAGGWRRF